MLKIFEQYKWYLYVAAFLAYSIGLWHVASVYTSANYEKAQKDAAITAVFNGNKQVGIDSKKNELLGKKKQEFSGKASTIVEKITSENTQNISPTICDISDSRMRDFSDLTDETNRALGWTDSMPQGTKTTK